MQVKDKLKIKSITFRNRIVMSPMCQYSAQGGFVNEWHLQHYAARAVGGVGLVMVEAAAVLPEGRITPYDLGTWSENHVEGLRHLAETIQSNGAIAGIQLAHAGRKASREKPAAGGEYISLGQGGWQTVAPSPIPFEENTDIPHELSISEIKNIIAAFASAVAVVRDAGFQVIEIHAAHGYLIHQFLSPLSNCRTDEYGGNFENRIRLLLEVLDAAKKEWPANLPVFVRLSVTEWAEGGWDVKEAQELSAILKAHGVDLIDCSSGGNIVGAKIPLSPGYQVPLSQAVRETTVLTSAVGLITTREQIDAILTEEKADMVMLGRELLLNPYFVLREYPELGWPPQYLRGKVSGMR